MAAGDTFRAAAVEQLEVWAGRLGVDVVKGKQGGDPAAVAFDACEAAKARGVAVTAGITPAHFMLSDIAVSDFRTFARLSPPLRAEADRQAVLAALADVRSASGKSKAVEGRPDARSPRYFL